MTPEAIAVIRTQVESLEAQAASLKAEQPRAAEAIAESAKQLYSTIHPHCWGCGALLQPFDPADHLCYECTDGLPLAFPY